MKRIPYQIDWNGLSNGANLVQIGQLVSELLAFEERYGRAGPGRVKCKILLTWIETSLRS